MERLEQMKVIANNLKMDSTKAEGDRGNRRLLREGFAFASGSDEHKATLAYVDTHLSWEDLFTICNILTIDYTDGKDTENDVNDDNDDDVNEDENEDGNNDENDDEKEDDDENEIKMDIQKLILSKKALRGLAKLFIQGEKGLNTKLKVYEKMKTRNISINKSSSSTTNKKTISKEEIRCFNCGELDHRSTTCQNESKGAKCFRCNKFGHKLIDCKKEKPKKIKENNKEKIKKTELVNSLGAPKGIYKNVEIADSQYNIINQKSYNKIGTLTLSDASLHFSGFGGSKVVPLGYFRDIISIDEHFQVTIYVVTDDVMTMEIVIGNELLSVAEVNIKQGDIIIISRMQEVNDIFSPSYIIEVNEPTVGHDISKKKKREVQNLLYNYVLKKVKDPHGTTISNRCPIEIHHRDSKLY
ncbi:hypothetical protein ACFW04_011251 [Cataglyphis niger]